MTITIANCRVRRKQRHHLPSPARQRLSNSELLTTDTELIAQLIGRADKSASRARSNCGNTFRVDPIGFAD